MNHKILEAKNISKSFGKIQALDDVNFHLYKGKIHGLLGENGAGKSSLMNILSGIYQPEKGSIIFDGEKQKKKLIPNQPQDWVSEWFIKNLD